MNIWPVGEISINQCPNIGVTNDWQEWLIKDSIVNEKGDGSFHFNRKAPTSGPSVSQSLNVQMSPTAQDASTSRTRTVVIQPPTPGVIEELLAFQRTMPSWKAWERESMDWEGTAEENTKKYVENFAMESDDS